MMVAVAPKTSRDMDTSYKFKIIYFNQLTADIKLLMKHECEKNGNQDVWNRHMSPKLTIKGLSHGGEYCIAETGFMSIPLSLI